MYNIPEMNRLIFFPIVFEDIKKRQNALKSNTQLGVFLKRTSIQNQGAKNMTSDEVQSVFLN